MKEGRACGSYRESSADKTEAQHREATCLKTHSKERRTRSHVGVRWQHPSLTSPLQSSSVFLRQKKEFPWHPKVPLSFWEVKGRGLFFSI